MASTIGEKELKTAWPVESGLTAGTTKQAGRSSYLKATVSSKLREVDLVGIR